MEIVIEDTLKECSSDTSKDTIEEQTLDEEIARCFQDLRHSFDRLPSDSETEIDEFLSEDEANLESTRSILMQQDKVAASDFDFWKERAVASRRGIRNTYQKESVQDSWLEKYSPDVKHSGWLIKRGHNVRNFKSRLFCIVGHELVYHDSYDSHDIRGKINLNTKFTVKLIPHNGFYLVQGSYSLLLYAMNSIDRDQWTQKLKKFGCDVTNEISSPKANSSKIDTVLHCGWLRKMGQVVKSYKRRWFILTKTKLTYYESPEAHAEKGSVDISKMQAYSVDSIKTGQRHSFFIQTSTRKIHLYADSEEIKLEWMRHLNQLTSDKSSGNNKIESDNINAFDRQSTCLKNIRNEVKLILASPYTPEGNTCTKFIKEQSHGQANNEKIRTFMGGLVEYMKIHRLNELRTFLDGCSISDIDKRIADIISELVEELIFHPLCRSIYNSIRSNEMKIETKSLRRKLFLLRKKSQSFFGIPESKQSSSEWNSAINTLNHIDNVTLPSTKRKTLLETARVIHETYSNEHVEAETLSADDFVPIFIYTIAHSNIADPPYLRELLFQFDLSGNQGEVSYFVTCFEIALEFIKSLVIAATVTFDTREDLGIIFEKNEISQRIEIVGLVENGQAYKIGRLNIGDELVAINGVDCTEKTITEIENTIKSINSLAEFSFVSEKDLNK